MIYSSLNSANKYSSAMHVDNTYCVRTVSAYLQMKQQDIWARIFSIILWQRNWGSFYFKMHLMYTAHFGLFSLRTYSVCLEIYRAPFYVDSRAYTVLLTSGELARFPTLSFLSSKTGITYLCQYKARYPLRGIVSNIRVCCLHIYQWTDLISSFSNESCI